MSNRVLAKTNVVPAKFLSSPWMKRASLRNYDRFLACPGTITWASISQLLYSWLLLSFRKMPMEKFQLLGLVEDCKDIFVRQMSVFLRMDLRPTPLMMIRWTVTHNTSNRHGWMGTWNYYAYNGPRTNNHLEGWYRGFQVACHEKCRMLSHLP